FCRCSGARPSPRCRSDASLLGEALEQGARSLLLRLLARAARALRAHGELLDHAFHFEGLAVCRALHGGHAVKGQRAVRRLQHLLQLGFRVLGGTLRVEALRPRAESREHRSACGVIAGVDEYGAEHGFERVGEDGRTRLGGGGELAFAEANERREPQLARQLRERLLAHQARAKSRELALREPRKALVELGRHGAAEHAVAEELESFVVLRAVAAVGQRLLEKLAPREAVAEPLLERFGEGRRAGTDLLASGG